MRNTIPHFAIVLLLLLPLHCKAIEKTPTEAQALINEAHVNYEHEQYPRALTLFIKAMEKAEEDHNYKQYCVCTGYIANIYDVFSDYESGIGYLLKGYKMATDYHLDELRNEFLTNIVTSYSKQGKVGEAKKYLKVLRTCPSKKDPVNGQYFLAYNEARILTAEGKYADAVKKHQETLTFAQEKNMKPIYELFQNSEIGNLYIKQKLYSQAVDQAKLCIAESKKINSGELLANAYKMMYDAYKGLGRSDSASVYLDKYYHESNNVYNLKSFYSAKNELNEYEDRAHHREVSRLHLQISRQTAIILFITGFLLIVTVLLIIIVWKNNKLKQAQRLVIARNRELELSENNSQKLLERYAKDANEEEVNSSETNSIGLTQEQINILLKRIVAIMNDVEKISQPDFSMQKLAAEIHSNTKYVSWIINETYGRNFKTLLNEKRIREAARRLTDKEHYGNKTIQTIYEELGYTNAVSFIRAFKKVNGMTPSEYQKRAAE